MKNNLKVCAFSFKYNKNLVKYHVTDCLVVESSVHLQVLFTLYQYGGHFRRCPSSYGLKL